MAIGIGLMINEIELNGGHCGRSRSSLDVIVLSKLRSMRKRSGARKARGCSCILLNEYGRFLSSFIVSPCVTVVRQKNDCDSDIYKQVAKLRQDCSLTEDMIMSIYMTYTCKSGALPDEA